MPHTSFFKFTAHSFKKYLLKNYHADQASIVFSIIIKFTFFVIKNPDYI